MYDHSTIKLEIKTQAPNKAKQNDLFTWKFIGFPLNLGEEVNTYQKNYRIFEKIMAIKAVPIRIYEIHFEQ